MLDSDGYPISVELPGMPVLEEGQTQHIRKGSLILFIVDNTDTARAAVELLVDKLTDQIGEKNVETVKVSAIRPGDYARPDFAQPSINDYAEKRQQLRSLRSEALHREGVAIAIFDGGHRHMSMRTALDQEADISFYVYHGVENVIVEAGKYRGADTRNVNKAISVTHRRCLFVN